MRAWGAQGPRGTRYEGVRVRIVAYPESYHPEDGRHRFVIQALDGAGRPVAQDPLVEERVPAPEIAAFIEASIDQGWALTPERSFAAIRKDN